MAARQQEGPLDAEAANKMRKLKFHADNNFVLHM